jgi:pimeloyl-ACP methyl ester carboxylesterase
LRCQHRLPGGRVLCFDEHNPDGAVTVFHFHGAPGARVDAAIFRPPPGGVRVIAPDRPGLGGSSPQPQRHLLDWPRDVAALADALGVARFAALGWSGGAPYALACAHMLGDRVRAVGLVGALPPLAEPSVAEALGSGRRLLELARSVPAAALAQLRAVALLARTPWLARASLRAMFAGADREVLERPDVLRAMLDSLAAAFAAGAEGARVDLAILGGRWGFDPAATRQPVALWHGEADRNAPVELGRWLAAAIPGCRATFFPGEGHLSLPARHGRRILEELAGLAA